jgi:SpoVK/Ycf46/Vps4 family AAA+-type ATPase
MKRNHISRLLEAILEGNRKKIIQVLEHASLEETGKGKGSWGQTLSRYARNLERERGPELVRLLPAQAKASLDSFQERVPTRTLEEVVAPEALLQSIRLIVQEHAHADQLAAHNLRPTLKILLIGPPGCGKTLLAEVLAHATGKTFHTLSMGRMVQSLLGDTIRNIENAFAGIAISNGVFLLDEFDALSTQRQREGEVTEMRRALNSLLIELDRFTGPSIVVAATNHPESMDAAFRRRFQAIIQFPSPELADTLELTKRTLARHNFPKIDPAPLAELFQDHHLSLHETEEATKALLTSLVIQGRETPNKHDLEGLKSNLQNRQGWRKTA